MPHGSGHSRRRPPCHVLAPNRDGHIGDSTRAKIRLAGAAAGIPVRFPEPPESAREPS